MRILGIEVPAALAVDWRLWLAPSIQPFFLSTTLSEVPSLAKRDLTPELRDTFRVYDVQQGLRTVWLDEESFAGLPKNTRARLVRAQVIFGRGAVPTVRAWGDLIDPQLLRAQADGHRFVWWPSLLISDSGALIERVISHDRTPSRHNKVCETTWMRCADVVPGARSLAGTFPPGSGPNCFGTVMGACGEFGAEDVWMRQPPFEEWLKRCTRTGGEDELPGTILVWRDADGVARHAAVTIGDGWGLEKPSQEWSSPRAVLTVREIIKSNRTRGLRLQRRKLAAAILVAGD